MHAAVEQQSTLNIFAIAIGMTGLTMAFVVFLRQVSIRRTAIDFKETEERLLEITKAGDSNGEAKPATHGDLAKDDIRDNELRGVVAELESRMYRLETTSERLRVRRQALLETYHNQGLSQSRISFGFSLMLGLLGFGVIVYAVLTKNQQTGTYIAGAVTEAVAALFFTQSNQARRLMADFFDKLRADRRLEESLKLTHDIDDAQLRASMQALVALQLIESTVSPSVLPGFGPDPQSATQSPPTAAH